MSIAVEKSWKNRLQEHCQKNKLGMPNYRIKQQAGASNDVKFQMEVEIDGRWYIGEESFISKKDAEHSAAQKACADLCRNDLEIRVRESSSVDGNDPFKHMPPEYADVENFISNMLVAFGAQIRKIRPVDRRGRYRVEISGTYRYCENVKREHKKNRVYFLVDPIQKIYFQKCYDPNCDGFQSAKQQIYIDKVRNNESVADSNGAQS